MPQKSQSFTDPSDYPPASQRPKPGPITPFPMNIPVPTADPTLELRRLIEQLQESSRDARAVAFTLQEEKDEITTQLENALRQVDTLRMNEREIRSQFVEITSVIRERDTALQETDRVRRTATEAQRQSEGAVRERNDMQRQRDDILRRQAEESRAKQQIVAQLTEAQKQTVTLRQARDASNNQNREITMKLSRLEDDFAELGYQREAAQKAQKQSQEELFELRRQISLIAADRDAGMAQIQDLTQQLDEARRKFLENAGKQTALGEAGLAQAAALEEARQHVASVTIERDAARTRTRELTAEIDVLRIQAAELREQASQPSVPLQEHEDLLRQVAAITSERETIAARERQLAEEIESRQENLALITAQLESAQAECDEARNALAASQRQFEEDLSARDRQHAQEAAQAVEMEERMETLRSQNTVLQDNLAAVNRRVVELSQAQHETRQLASRFEKQRLAMIDLGTRFEAAQREIVELSASLAEARLAARFANSRAAKEAAEAIKEQLLPVMGSIEESAVNLEASTSERSQPLAPEIAETLGDKEARSALNAMRRCFIAFQKNSNDASLLNELYCHAYGFSERARVSGFIALHRLSGTFAHLVHELYEFPELLNASVMRTIGSTVDFLLTLIKDRNVAQIPDPAKALVYIVDDDADNGDAIKMSMETMMLRANCAVEPSAALAELAAERHDLIFLDVNLPGMDGFALASLIRQIPGYGSTPIIFVTGMASLENRVQSSLSGASDFVGKPFNLHELNVKTLTLILKAGLLMD